MVDTLVFAVFTVVYLAVTLYLGYLGYRQTKSADDFMVAGRHVSRGSSDYPTERRSSAPRPSSASAASPPCTAWA